MNMHVDKPRGDDHPRRIHGFYIVLIGQGYFPRMINGFNKTFIDQYIEFAITVISRIQHPAIFN